MNEIIKAEDLAPTFRNLLEEQELNKKEASASEETECQKEW